jgi:hypothetical protein
MPIYDFHCTKCGHEVEDVLCKMTEGMICEKCFSKMEKACNCSHFKLVYNPKIHRVSWGDQGYSESQYWRDVKEARARGEKVKGANED